MLRPEQTATASYMLLVDAAGAVEIGVGDMDAHRSITPQLVGRPRLGRPTGVSYKGLPWIRREENMRNVVLMIC